MKIVLDTNVLVSGLLSPFGPPGAIVRLVASGAIRLCFDARILSEYEAVLRRPRFSFDPSQVQAVLDVVRLEGHAVVARPLRRRLPDPDDEAFLEVALAGGARVLVTGNLRHYPAGRRQGIRVVSPASFVSAYRDDEG